MKHGRGRLLLETIWALMTEIATLAWFANHPKSPLSNVAICLTLLAINLTLLNQYAKFIEPICVKIKAEMGLDEEG